MGDEDPPVVYGRQHDPEGLVEVLRLLDERYPGLPIVITEHGFANYDHKRAASIVRHLESAHKAIEEGIMLEGYYHWSILDNFEWGEGFDTRFGLFRVDYEGDLERSSTVASDTYGKVTASHGLTQDLLDNWGGTGPLESR
jgi:beta-glucosidase